MNSIKDRINRMEVIRKSPRDLTSSIESSTSEEIKMELQVLKQRSKTSRTIETDLLKVEKQSKASDEVRSILIDKDGNESRVSGQTSSKETKRSQKRKPKSSIDQKDKKSMSNFINDLNISQIHGGNTQVEGSSFYGSEDEASSWCNGS